MSTLVSQATLEQRVRAEGITEKPIVIAPRWAESAPASPSAQSALIHCDLILRSDGSLVLLDGAMAADSIGLAETFRKHGTGGKSWSEFVAETQSLPPESKEP